MVESVIKNITKSVIFFPKELGQCLMAKYFSVSCFTSDFWIEGLWQFTSLSLQGSHQIKELEKTWQSIGNPVVCLLKPEY